MSHTLNVVNYTSVSRIPTKHAHLLNWTSGVCKDQV